MAVRAIFLFLCVSVIHAKVWRLGCDDIRKFVDGHNMRRVQLAKGALEDQPPASRMNAMIWDNELATKAAEWASHNKFQHNPNRTIPSKRFGTGENIYYIATTDTSFKFNVDEAADAWFSEHKDYKYKPLSMADFTGPQVGHYTQFNVDEAADAWFSEHKDYKYKPLSMADFTGPQVGHYTQMAWSKSTHLGCGVSQYPDGAYTVFFVVCNYGPAGNMLGETPYKSGSPANKLSCGTGDCSRRYGDTC